MAALNRMNLISSIAITFANQQKCGLMADIRRFSEGSSLLRQNISFLVVQPTTLAPPASPEQISRFLNPIPNGI
jgi:hypothetical protein